MKKLLLTIIIGLLSSCVTASYIQTGKVYTPLPKDVQVDVVMRSKPDYKIEQIGIVTLKAGNLEMQLNKAKEIARQKGGDVIILAEVGSEVMVNGNLVTTSEVRTFEIAKKIVD